MTGISAVVDLFGFWQESRDDKKKKEEPKLEPDPEEVADGFIDNESEWHFVVQNQAWDTLLEMLQDYDFRMYNPKETKKKKHRLRLVGAVVRAKKRMGRQAEEEELPPSPLLALNDQGETPLHLALRYLAPDKYIVRMVFCERGAALVADEQGRLPLHWACLYDRSTAVLDRLIRANFHHMQRRDNEGKTPLCYALAQVVEQKDREEDPTCFWGIPRTHEEATWQERQETIWSKVRFILLSYSTRRKVFVEAERDILLEVLEHAAPPGVVEVSILAAQGLLRTDPTLAWNAVRLFMKRQYPTKNLQLLLHHFPVQNIESLEAVRKMLTEHYYDGCTRRHGQKLSFREEMEKYALEDNFKRTLACQEWWNKIQCLLNVCGHQNETENKKTFDKKYLLHAALSSSDTPPSLVQLLMVMSTESIKLQHPYNQSLLIHLICRNWRYNLYPHSKKIGLGAESNEPPMEQVLKILMVSDESLTRKRHRKKLPIHFAIDTSKSVEFLGALVQKDQESLAVRDPQTKLYPFQMAALGNMNKNAGLWAHSRYDADEWKRIEPEERAKAVEDIIEEQEVEQLNSIYYLLRQFPAAILPTATNQKAHEFRDADGKGMVSSHFLMLVYERDEGGEYILLKDNLSLLHKAIKTCTIPEELEAWWAKLKFWIRYTNTSDQNLPSGEEHLLHAAVANPDVPPLVVELLLALFPKSPFLPIHGDSEFPIHIAAATDPYQPQPYETIESKTLFEILAKLNLEALLISSPSGTPVDIAQAHGTRSEEEMKHLGVAMAKAILTDMATALDDELDYVDESSVPPCLEASFAEPSENTEVDEEPRIEAVDTQEASVARNTQSRKLDIDSALQSLVSPEEIHESEKDADVAEEVFV